MVKLLIFIDLNESKFSSRNTLKKFITIIFFIVCSNISFGQTIPFDSLIQKGINQIYSLEFEDAEETFGLIKKYEPEHPATKFFPAMVTWWKIMADLDNEEFDKILIKQLDETIEFCDNLLKKNPTNIDAIFFKGGALGFRGRLYSIRESWLNAASDGKDAMPLVHRAFALDSTNVDVQLGFGIYNYYADVIPEKYPFLKPVMFFFPKGDRYKGLEQLVNAAYNGKYTKAESKYFLMTLYYKFEDNDIEALKYAEELIEQFPNNPAFHKHYGRLLRRTSHITKSTEEFKEMYRRCEVNMRGYNDKIRREASYYIADEHWRNADFDEAIKYYKECSDLSVSFDQEDDGFNVISLLQIGKIYDVLGKRDTAIAYYKKVLKLDKHRDSHDQAKLYLKEPFKR